ncbi:MAG: N-(5'-phosphoribosyl)anthranilate isomerase [Phycisphaerae bacterium]|jgi:phosphoribosylanthranilate isomerase
MARTRIKICGIRDDDALLAAAEAGADAVGFVFDAASPRYVDPDTAFALMSALPPFMASVAVVRDPDIDAFVEIEETCPTTYIQLHGADHDKIVKALGPDLFKVVASDSPTFASDLERWERSEDVLAIFIECQGSPVDWEGLARHTDHVAKPLILGGALTVASVAEAIRAVRPYAVDAAACVESSPGEIDAARIEAFCAAVRAADA